MVAILEVAFVKQVTSNFVQNKKRTILVLFILFILHILNSKFVIFLHILNLKM